MLRSDGPWQLITCLTFSNRCHPFGSSNYFTVGAIDAVQSASVAAAGVAVGFVRSRLFRDTGTEVMGTVGCEPLPMRMEAFTLTTPELPERGDSPMERALDALRAAYQRVPARGFEGVLQRLRVENCRISDQDLDWLAAAGPVEPPLPEHPDERH